MKQYQSFSSFFEELELNLKDRGWYLVDEIVIILASFVFIIGYFGIFDKLLSKLHSAIFITICLSITKFYAREILCYFSKLSVKLMVLIDEIVKWFLVIFFQKDKLFNTENWLDEKYFFKGKDGLKKIALKNWPSISNVNLY